MRTAFIHAGVMMCASMLACAGAPTRPAPVLAMADDPMAGCEALGEVAGESYDSAPSMEAAEGAALAEARRRGATHLRPVASKTGFFAAHTITFTGMAFRCPTGR